MTFPSFSEGTPLMHLNLSDDESLGLSLLRQKELSESFKSAESLPKRTRTYSRWSPMEEGVTLAWSDLTISATIAKNGKRTFKRIINGVSGAVKPGSLVALMGASGAGKSTLMSALAYRHSGDMAIEGDILINGRPIGNYLKYISGYMHQEDIFVGYLTVIEHMTIMAHLKLDRRIPSYEKKHKIRQILHDLGLGHCMNTRIGIIGEDKTLSGGEKKRLAFATELLTDPPILYCDEPTTGLDSSSAQKIVTIMNLMASRGKTILCTIHQPSSDIFAMFSQLILVAEGRIAYMGPTNEANEFFDSLGYKCPTSYNPADFYIKTLATTPGFEEGSKQAIKRICDHFAVSDYAKEFDVVVQYEFHMGRTGQPKTFELKANFKECFWWTKTYWLTYRWFVEILRNPAVQGLRILQKIAIAVMVGLCYLGTNATTQSGVQSVQGAIFMLVVENTFNPMYSVLEEFPKDYPLFLREYKAGLYSPPVYYISRVVSMLPGVITEPVLFTIITYWLSGLRATTYAFLITTLSAALTMNISIACGVFFSNAFESVPTAMAYLVPFDYLLMITSGQFIKLDTLHAILSWTKYLSWLMYSTEVMSVVQWSDVSNITCEVPQNVPCLKTGADVLNKFNFSENNLSIDITCMFLLCIIFYVLGYICLILKAKRK